MGNYVEETVFARTEHVNALKVSMETVMCTVNVSFKSNDYISYFYFLSPT